MSCLEEDLWLPGFLVTPSAVAMVAVLLSSQQARFLWRRVLCRGGPRVANRLTSRHHTPLSVFSFPFVESISQSKYCGSVISWWKSVWLTEQMQSKWREKSSMNPWQRLFYIHPSTPHGRQIWTFGVSMVAGYKSQIPHWERFEKPGNVTCGWDNIIMLASFIRFTGWSRAVWHNMC